MFILNFEMKAIFFLLILSRVDASSRRRRSYVFDIPYCLGKEGEENCRQCVGTTYIYTRTYQHGHPIKLTGCCRRGVFYNNVCYQDSFLDKDGNLCKFPMGLNEDGECYMDNFEFIVLVQSVSIIFTVIIVSIMFVLSGCCVR